jgi:hypothetical protein
MHKRYGQQYIYGKYGFVDASTLPSTTTAAQARTSGTRHRLVWTPDYLGIDQGSHHLDDREPSQRAHLARDARRPAHSPRSRARGLRGRAGSAILRADQPALRISSGSRPVTDSSVSRKLVCQAVMEFREHVEHRLMTFAPLGERHVERLLDRSAPCRARRRDSP